MRWTSKRGQPTSTARLAWTWRGATSWWTRIQMNQTMASNQRIVAPTLSQNKCTTIGRVFNCSRVMGPRRAVSAHQSGDCVSRWSRWTPTSTNFIVSQCAWCSIALALTDYFPLIDWSASGLANSLCMLLFIDESTLNERNERVYSSVSNFSLWFWWRLQ